MSNKEKPPKKSPTSEPRMESLEIGSALYTTRLTSKFRNRELWQKPDKRIIEAVIPGLIQRIMAKEGDEVAAGTPLLILEAMKMRNEILAPVGGVVRKIHVSEGEMVPKSHLLIEMD
ncbi:MAG: acetyl-CoA carboxylase biotin carboxyl carrier protein subunit [Bacteroidales bacterium]|nr:acetyl-CoA carboxylase biotin carboxyl carrier protein subunit [Bacteroidales bacterium]